MPGLWQTDIEFGYTSTSRFDWSEGIMEIIQASDAKTQFLRILDDVEKGQSVVITRRGKRIARITPEPEIDRERAKKAFANIQALRKLNTPVSVEELLSARNEGRR
jgi:prevent-host-death family protein